MVETPRDVSTESQVVVKGEVTIIANGKEVRYHYYRYCDDIVILGTDKKGLWKLRDYLTTLLAELGLEIKPSEAVRPLTEGIDYLGYNTFVDDSKGVESCVPQSDKETHEAEIRTAVLSRVKSRKRRQSLIGSFFGMAAHADCRHLLKTLLTPQEYKKLKHKRK